MPVRISLLLAILLVGAWFRFHNLTETEPFIADEAAYILEARFLNSVASNCMEVIRLKRDERRTGQQLITKEQIVQRFQEGLDGRKPWYARPLHVSLIAAAQRLFGPDRIWLGGLVSALFGSLSILLVYALACRLYHPVAGLLAAALFSLSGYQVAYCHTGLTEQVSLFFLLLAGLFHIRGLDRLEGVRWKSLLLCGFALGVCFVTHYRMLTSIAAFFLWEAFFQKPCSPEESRKARFRTRLQAMVVLAAGIAIPIGLFEVPYYLLTLGFHRLLEAVLPFQTYLEQLLVQVFVSIYTNLLSTQKAFSLSNLLTYPYLLWKLSGPVWPVALFGALFVAIRRRMPADRWALVLFLTPFLLCTLLQPRARYACSFLAFGSILMASALCGASMNNVHRVRAGAKATWLRAVVIAALLLTGIFYAHRATQPRLSYGPAMDFLRSRGSMKHLSTYPLLSQVYAGVKQVPEDWPPPTETELLQRYEVGYRYVLIDPLKDAAAFFFQQFGVSENPVFRQRLDLLNRLEEEMEPVFVTKSLHLEPIQTLFEVNHNFLQTRAYYAKMDDIPNIRMIRIYDLDQRYGKTSTGPREERRH